MKQRKKTKEPKPNLKHKRPVRRNKQTTFDKEATVREVPKIRTVKPELFIHEDLFDAEMDYRLPLRVAFIGLITCCDREGRFRWQPRRLKLHTVPYDAADMNSVLEALVERGFILKYEYLGKWYGCIPSFLRHQKISHHEAESFLPGPNESNSFETEITSTTLDVNPHKPEKETNFDSEWVVSSGKKFVEKHKNQNENVECLALKTESLEDNFTETVTENSLVETHFLCESGEACSENSVQNHDRKDEKSEDLKLKIETSNNHFQKTRIEASFFTQLNSSFYTGSIKPLSEKFNKNNEIRVNLSTAKSEVCIDDFKIKNVASLCAQGKEGKGMEGKGIERERIEEKGVEWNRIEEKGIEKKGSEDKRNEIKRNNFVAASSMQPHSIPISVQQIFEHWKTVMQHPDAKLDPKRQECISHALKLGYQPQELCQAIQGCSLTAYNMGNNPEGQRFDGLHVIFKDAHQIERFMQHYQRPPKPLRAADKLTQGNLNAAQRWMEKKMREVPRYANR